MNDHPNDHPNSRSNDRSIAVGETVGPDSGVLPRLRPDGAAMRRVAGRPWMRALIARQLRSPYYTRYQPAREATVTDRALGHHAVIVGSTGSGKTRLALRLIAEQLRLGRSLVMLDPKTGTIDHALRAALDAGVSPDRVTVVTPGDLSRGVPGWNPLAAGMPIHLAAAELVSALGVLYASSWGPRLADILSNALPILAAKGLSLYELQAFLTSDDFRRSILSQRPPPLSAEDAVTYRVAEAYFRAEFDLWPKADRSAAIGAVLNKTRGLLRSAFFQYFLCPPRNTLDFARLWERQEVVLIHIDDAVLGSDGSSVLSGLVTHCLHNTAMRVGHPGANPVVLSVDELGVQNPFLTEALGKILAVAREKNLRLMAVCQYLGQIDPKLRQALLSQSMVQAFFNLGDGDADIVGDALAASEEDYVAEATIRPEGDDRKTGYPRMTTWEQPVLDGSGSKIDVDPAMWEMMRRRDLLAPLARRPYVRPNPLDDLRRVAAESGIPRLYVICPDSGQPVEVGQYLDGVSDTDYCFRGPREVTLEITVPRPKVTNVSRASAADRSRNWARKLRKLPRRHAVLRVRDGRSPTTTVSVADVPDLGAVDRHRCDGFAREALALRGRPVELAEREAVERTAFVERMSAAPEPKPPMPTAGPSRADSRNSNGKNETGERPMPEAAPGPAQPAQAGEPSTKSARPPRRHQPITIGRIADDGSIS